MNCWLIAALVLALGLFPCGLVCVRTRTLNRLVAVQLAGLLVALLIVLLAEGLQRPSLYDLALAVGLLSYPSTMVFARFLERWL